MSAPKWLFGFDWNKSGAVGGTKLPLKRRNMNFSISCFRWWNLWPLKLSSLITLLMSKAYTRRIRSSDNNYHKIIFEGHIGVTFYLMILWKKSLMKVYETYDSMCSSGCFACIWNSRGELFLLFFPFRFSIRAIMFLDSLVHISGKLIDYGGWVVVP